MCYEVTVGVALYTADAHTKPPFYAKLQVWTSESFSSGAIVDFSRGSE